jgi:hypothetical protein
VNLRWNSGRSSYRPPEEPIDPERYFVQRIDEMVAKPFVVEHHYSRSYPAARLRVGLFRRRRAWPELVGVAVFSVPAQQLAIPRWLGVPALQGVELGRFVLLDEVEGNGETWFLARAFKELRIAKPDVRAVLSYSDPLERRAADGTVVMPGHVGTIYQAFNGRYLGRSREGEIILGPDARPISPRALSKIRTYSRGQVYARDAFLRAGAPAQLSGESDTAWVRRALAEGPFRRIRHPGNHVYGWALDPRVALGPTEPYPKKQGAAA